MAQVEAMLAGPDPNNPLLNIKKDLIQPLGNRLSFVSDLTENRGLPVSRILMAWQLDDSERLTALFDRALQLGGGALPLQKKVVAGNNVYAFPLGDLIAGQMPAQDVPVPVGTVGFTITKTHMFLTTHVELLDKILTGAGQEGLAENTVYRQIASKFPPKTSAVSYMRGEEQGRAGYQMVKSGQLAKVIRQATQDNPELGNVLGGLIKAIDGSNLPAFDAIKQYMSNSGGYGIMDDKGVQFVQFTLK